MESGGPEDGDAPSAGAGVEAGAVADAAEPGPLQRRQVARPKQLRTRPMNP
jgi:hypothetical protein